MPKPVVKSPVVTAHAILLRTGVAPVAGSDSKKRHREEESTDAPSPEDRDAPDALAVLYVCQVVSKRGKFLKDKAVALGVTPYAAAPTALA